MSFVGYLTCDNRTLFSIDISKFIYKCFIRNVITIQSFIPVCLLKFTNNFTNISICYNSLFVINKVIFIAINLYQYQSFVKLVGDH